MTIPANDGCPWPVDPACLNDSWESDFDAPTQVRAIALAGATLRRLTGYRVGGCPVQVRPCNPFNCITGPVLPRSLYGDAFTPFNFGGVWSNVWSACGCGQACGHTSLNTLTLPGPVGGVSEVKINGVVKATNTYWVSANSLIAISPLTWPLTQDLTLPDTAANTFSVTYLNSYPVDGMGAAAAGRLAYQFALACTGGDCELPATVTSVVRQGVSYQIAAGTFPGGLTGLREVDAYVALWNPNHLVQRTGVWSP